MWLKKHEGGRLGRFADAESGAARDASAAGPIANGLDKTAHFRAGRDVYQALTLIGKDGRKSVNRRRDWADAVSCS
jgi:hypothetical protein